MALDRLLPPLTRCSVFYHDVARAAGDKFDSWQQTLHSKHYPLWALDPFSTEVHLQRALARSGWRTRSAAEAEIIFVAANLSLMCMAGKAFSARSMWQTGMQAVTMSNSNSRRRPPPLFVTSFQYRQGCMLPWTPGPLQPHLVLADRMVTELRRGGTSKHRARRPAQLIAPFAISSPRWLIGGSTHFHDAAYRSIGVRATWRQRPLLFFGGHVPKLYVNPLRYRLWSRLRSEARVSTQSRTIGCTVAAYGPVCRRDAEWRRRGGNASFFHNWCRAECGSKGGGRSGDGGGSDGGGERVVAAAAAAAAAAGAAAPAGDATATQAARGEAGARRVVRSKTGQPLRQQRVGADSCVGSWTHTPQRAASILESMCKAYEEVDFAAEYEDMRRDGQRSGTREQYLATAARHRFCMVAQGG